VLEAIAAVTESGPCVTHVGPGGAGHFVKMVHNGIEYADMQLIAECYDLLRRGLGFSAGEAAETFARWNDGPLGSFLIELTSQVLRVRDAESGLPLVDLVEDKAGQKGTGQWTVRVALELGVPVPSIAAAVDGRVLSAMKEERVTAARLLTGPAVDPPGDRAEALSALHDALWTAKVSAYAQGSMLIQRADQSRSWSIDLREVARIWKGGCIIRAKLLDDIMQAYGRSPKLASLLVDPSLGARVQQAQAGLRTAVAMAATAGIAAPGLCASLAYLDAYRSARLPQNLIQAQRDAFGAHTYERTDHPERGFVHTDWLGEARVR
jgi:6-phosphogluconate dehydrogenase